MPVLSPAEIVNAPEMTQKQKIEVLVACDRIAMDRTPVRMDAWSARRRLRQSIAHLDERLLADIGLDPEDLGFAERFARRRAANLQNFWSLEWRHRPPPRRYS
jgi:uncharacterized protein YjiS (DUF1127 family)